MKGVLVMKPMMYSMIFLVMISSVLAIDITQITDTDGTEASIDVAFDSSGAHHLVYERSGTVYYRFDDGDEQFIADGNKPVVCVDTADVVHLAYLDGQDIYYAYNDGEWSTPEHIVDGYDVDIACDARVHMTYTNTDSKPDIMYLNIDDGAVSVPVIIKDGYYWYESGSRTGRYYYSPRITTDGTNYYIAFKHYALDGAMGWTDWYTYIQIYSSADGTTASSPYKYKSHYGELSKNAVSYNDGPVVFYQHGSNLYKGMANWVETLVDTASAPAAQSNQYAFVKEGEISWFDGSDLVVVGQGSDPVIGSAAVYFTMNGDVYRTASVEQEDPCTDEDQDGYCADVDCNDNNPNSWRIDSYWVDYDEDGFHLFGLDNMDDQDRIAICYGEKIPYPYVAQTMGRDCDDDDAMQNDILGCEDDGNSSGGPGGDDPIDVPEFGIIGAAVALLVAGLFVARRR